MTDELFSIEPVIAWRAWKTEVGQLRSFVYGFMWTPYEAMVASCRADPNYLGTCKRPDDHGPPPCTRCKCGIYALKSYENTAKMTGTLWDGRQVVVGRVKLWGHVIETELGYRAQYAYPLDLMSPNGDCQELCDRYGVEQIEASAIPEAA